MNVALAIFWKDVLIEWRSRDRVVAMLVFSLLVVIIFQFALPGGTSARSQALAPGLLWVAIVLSALFGLGRAFTLELENDALAGLALAPTDRGWIFLGKTLANVAILAPAQAATAAAFGLVFQIALWEFAGRLALVVLLGSIGLCSVGTLFSAVAVRTRFREVMLPLLMLPLLVPVVSGSVRATTELFTTGSLPGEPLQLLAVADVAYLIVSFLTFDYVLDE